MEVTLLGTGDTTGTPTIGCGCDTCTAARERGIERSRFSVHVRNEHTGESLLIDCSPDFRSQFLTRDVALPDAVLITHIHFDHLDGLGNAFRLFSELPVFAVNEIDSQTGESVADTVRGKYDYLDALSVRGETPLESVEICGFEVTFVPVTHPPLVCYGVVIESGDVKLSITGDTNYAIPDASRERLSGPDLLIADAIAPADLCEHHPAGGDHYDSAGVPRTFAKKHMTREGALALADELRAEKTRLVHISHFYSADEAFRDPLAVDGERYVL
ncbi:MAG TPA: MBL fold metallo-hydrolase [Halococcus sp.]|nr:MBL fold metallo-hydrolase [Halococcus sp.]